MDVTLMSLPSELLSLILSHLDITSLLSFAKTNHTCQVLAHKQIQHLNLAVFSKLVHANLALETDTLDDTDTVHNINIARTASLADGGSSKNHNPAIHLSRQIAAQNKLANSILSKPATRNLRSLSLHIYDVRSSDLVSTIATKLSKLTELQFNCYHPYIHERSLGSNFWRDTPDGTPAWNALAGLGAEARRKLCLRNLQVLKINRAGITSAQLRSLVMMNPKLKTLHLRNVAGVDLEFVEWLAGRCHDGACKLQEVILEGCGSLQMLSIQHFEWLRTISKGDSRVTSLSLWRCRNISRDVLWNLMADPEWNKAFAKFESFLPTENPPQRVGNLSGNPLLPALLAEGSAPIIDPGKHFSETGKIAVDPKFMVGPGSAAAVAA